MAWGEYSGNQTAGTAPAVTYLEAMLTAHPAWDFVEEVIQYYDTIHTATSTNYHVETYTCRVWKNLGTLNGTGKDFFVAIVQMNNEYRNPTNFADVHVLPQNAVWFLPFEEYNTTTHRFRRTAGRGIYSHGSAGSDPLYLDADEDFSPHGDLWFNIVEAQLSDDETSWGTYDWWGRNIATVPSNLRANTSLWDATYECFIEWDNQYYADVYDGTPPDPVYGPGPAIDSLTAYAWFRVTNQGILVYSENADVTNTNYPQGGYVGLGDESARPEETRTGFPLMFSYNLWMNENNSTSPFTRLPEIGETYDIVEHELEGGQIYDYDFSVNGGRLLASYPGVEAWPVMPARALLSPTNPDQYYGLVYDPGMIVPGLYYVCMNGTNTFQRGDTISSPIGHECVFVGMGYSFPTKQSSDKWSIIDKELT